MPSCWPARCSRCWATRGCTAQATALLTDALDESYRNDSIWGVPQRDYLWLRGETVLEQSILVDFADEIIEIDGTVLAPA